MDPSAMGRHAQEIKTAQQIRAWFPNVRKQMWKRSEQRCKTFQEHGNITNIRHPGQTFLVAFVLQRLPELQQNYSWWRIQQKPSGKKSLVTAAGSSTCPSKWTNETINCEGMLCGTSAAIGGIGCAVVNDFEDALADEISSAWQAWDFMTWSSLLPCGISICKRLQGQSTLMKSNQMCWSMTIALQVCLCMP